MNKPTNRNVNPAFVELVQIGNGISGTKITGNSPEETKHILRRAFEASKERMKRAAIS
ncbi:hypothetical protein BRC2024_QFGIOCBO_CDS_0236 [Acinetobacter phage vB_AbaM_PhT2-v2]